MAAFLISVTNTETGTTSKHRVNPRKGIDPKLPEFFIGSAASNELVLKGLAPKHASVIRRGQRTLVRSEPGAPVRVNRAPVDAGEPTIVNSQAFELGPYMVEVRYD